MKKLTALLVGLFAFCLLAKAQGFVVKDGILYDTKGNLLNGEHDYTEGGQLTATYNFKEGKKDGPVTYYYDQKVVKEKGFYKHGRKDGQWIRFDQQGNKIADVNFVDGKKHGRWILWDSEGNQLYDMVYDMGEKKGTWSMYDEKGNVVMELNHD